MEPLMRKCVRVIFLLPIDIPFPLGYHVQNQPYLLDKFTEVCYTVPRGTIK